MALQNTLIRPFWLFLALLILMSSSWITGRAEEIEFIRSLDVNDAQDVCEGAECFESKIWCVCNQHNTFAQFKSIFGELVFSVNSNAKHGACIEGDSSDSRLHVEVISAMLWETGKPSLNMAEAESMRQNCDVSGFQDLLMRLKKSAAPATHGLDGMLTKGIRTLKDSVGLSCRKEVAFSPYGVSCVILERDQIRDDEHSEELRLTVERKQFSWRGPALIATGWVLIELAPWLSQQIFLYYASGTTIGVFLCVFLLTWLVLKRVTSSKHSAWMAITVQAVFGVAATFLTNIFEILVDSYRNELIYYIAGSTLLSFAVTYYFLRGSNGQPNGPSPALKDLVRWFLIGVGYVCTFHSTRSLIWSGIIFIALFLHKVIMPFLNQQAVKLWKILCPNWGIAKMGTKYIAGPFLTQEEYREQGEFETALQTRELFESEDFRKWIAKNIDRIKVLPRQYSEDNDEMEVEEEERMYE